MKFVSNGACLKPIAELAAYEYSYFGMAWMPINDRIAYVLVGSNNKDAGNWDVVFEADLVPYTGKIVEYTDTTDINGNRLIFDHTWYFKNGFLHNDSGPAAIHIYTNHKGVETKAHNAIDGLFEDPRGEEWAKNIFNRFGSEE